MEWSAMEREEVEKVATPDAFSVPVPSEAAPSMKVTVPLGVPVPAWPGLTVAVKVTDWPEAAGFAEEATVVVLESAGVKASERYWKVPVAVPLEAMKRAAMLASSAEARDPPELAGRRPAVS